MILILMNVAKYFFLAAFTMVLYDHMLTFAEEVLNFSWIILAMPLMWTKRWRLFGNARNHMVCRIFNLYDWFSDANNLISVLYLFLVVCFFRMVAVNRASLTRLIHRGKIRYYALSALTVVTYGMLAFFLPPMDLLNLLMIYLLSLLFALYDS
jgi:hypothetical protein